MVTHGEYVVTRLLPDFVRSACREQNIQFTSFSDDWMLCLERNGVRKWILGYTFSINSASAVALTSDKVATHQALVADALPSIEHYLARSRASTKVLSENLNQIPTGQPVVIKPLEGTSGHGIHLFPSLDQAVDHLSDQAHTDWTVSPWYDIAGETRLIICGNELLCAYEKHRPQKIDGLLFYNLGMGAHAVNVTPQPQVLDLAMKAMKSIGLGLAAVDIVMLSDGTARILEVNGGIMMEHYARQSDEYKNRAQEMYGAIIAKMFG